MASDLPEGYFGTFKYNRSTPTDSYIDPTKVMAQKEQMMVSFQHEPSGRAIFFKAFIIAFTETYNSDWVSEAVFGRSDPIQHFKQTTRRIALGLKIPASTDSEAFENLGRVQLLAQFLYPNYTKRDNMNALTLSQNPFVRLKVMNLARKISAEAAGGDGGDDGSTNKSNVARYGEYKSTGDANEGLLGVITNLNISHNLENSDIGVIQKGVNTILSKMIEINLDFTVVHETHLGWNDKGEFESPLFPYGVNLGEEYTQPNGNDGDRTEAEKKLQQQQILSDKRYLKAWGEARLRNDIAYLTEMATLKFERTALRKAPGTKDKEKIKALTAKINRNKANVSYLTDTVEGAGERMKAARAAREAGTTHRYADFVN